MYDGWLGLPASGTQSFQSPNSPKLPTSWYTKWPAISSVCHWANPLRIPLGTALCLQNRGKQAVHLTGHRPPSTMHLEALDWELGRFFGLGMTWFLDQKIQKAGKHHGTPWNTLLHLHNLLDGLCSFSRRALWTKGCCCNGADPELLPAKSTEGLRAAETASLIWVARCSKM